MANEITVHASLFVKKGNNTFQSRPSRFLADMAGNDGPTPGTITVPTTGKVVSFSELTEPGVILMMNIDSTNYVEWGLWDGTNFDPIGEILPGGPPALFTFSRNFTEQVAGTGTGTTAGVKQLMLIANTADVNVNIFCFER